MTNPSYASGKYTWTTSPIPTYTLMPTTVIQISQACKNVREWKLVVLDMYGTPRDLWSVILGGMSGHQEVIPVDPVMRRGYFMTRAPLVDTAWKKVPALIYRETSYQTTIVPWIE